MIAVYLPGFFTIPVVDRDEARFAQASRQMAESADLVVPRVQGKLRLNKPPLIYWTQSACAWALSGGDLAHDAIWMYRTPSLLAAVGIALVTWRWGREMFDPRAAWLGAVLLTLCPIFWWEARQARADMVLVLWTTLSLWMLWRVWHSPRGGLGAPILFWVFVGAGVMTKGPVTPMVCGLGVIALSAATGRWRWLWRLRPLAGLVVLGLWVLPWVAMVAREIGWETYFKTVLDETLGRSLEAKEGHSGPPLYHALAVWVLFWPGCIGLGAAAARVMGVGLPRRARHARWWQRRVGRGAEVFLLSVLIPAWIVFELVSTKLPHYTMPLYPVLALLAARGVLWLGARREERRVFERGWVRATLRGWQFAGVVVWGGGAGAAWVAMRPLHAHTLDIEHAWLALATVVPLTVVVVAWFLLRSGAAIRTLDLARTLRVGLIMFGVSAAMIGLSLGSDAELWTSRAVVRAARTIDPGGTRPIASTGYAEDSLVFETRGRLERLSTGDVGAWVAAHPDGLLVIPRERAPDIAGWAVAGEAEGYNYTKGRRENLVLLVRER